MRIIESDLITGTIEKLCVEANCRLPEEVSSALSRSLANEGSVSGRKVLGEILDNAYLAEKESIPVCQDTGMAVFFVELGSDVCVSGADMTEAINEGVRRGYINGYLRKSVVDDPILRKNTQDNTPAVIYYDIVKGDRIVIDFIPKGFGSENKSALKMLMPSEGVEGIISFVVETVRAAGPDACPPVIVGVGVGGTMDKAAVLSKKALTLPFSEGSELPHIKAMEDELMKRINALGTGPAGLGGNVTALAVRILPFPTHIAGLPVAVNISCHACRHLRAVI